MNKKREVDAIALVKDEELAGVRGGVDQPEQNQLTPTPPNNEGDPDDYD